MENSAVVYIIIGQWTILNFAIMICILGRHYIKNPPEKDIGGFVFIGYIITNFLFVASIVPRLKGVSFLTLLAIFHIIFFAVSLLGGNYFKQKYGGRYFGFIMIIISLMWIIMSVFALFSAPSIDYNIVRWWDLMILLIIASVFVAGMFILESNRKELGHRIMLSSIAFYLFFNVFVCYKVFSNEAGKIQRNIVRMETMCKKLNVKRGEISKLLFDYQGEIAALETEIEREKDAYHIYNYDQAIQNNKISQGLILIQHKQAYVSKLNEIIPKLEAGFKELRYMQKKSEDDLRIVTVLGEEEIGDLIGDINKVIEKYKPEEFVIKIDESQLESPEQIWNRIAR